MKSLEQTAALETAINPEDAIPQKQKKKNGLTVPKKNGLPRRKTSRARPNGDYLSPRVRQAILLMVFEQYTRDDAAIAVGLAKGSLVQAFHMNKPAQFFTDCVHVLRTGYRAEAVQAIYDLMKHSNSDNVKLAAAKYLESGGKDGQAQINVNVDARQDNRKINIGPGYVIVDRQAQDKVKQIANQAVMTNKPLIEQG